MVQEGQHGSAPSASASPARRCRRCRLQVPRRNVAAKALGQKLDQQLERLRLVLARQVHGVDTQRFGLVIRQQTQQRAPPQIVADEVGGQHRDAGASQRRLPQHRGLIA